MAKCLFPACGTAGRLVRAKDTQMPGAVPSCAGGPASLGWQACCDLPVVACEPVCCGDGRHNGPAPGQPWAAWPSGPSADVCTHSGSWRPATCVWAVSMVATPTLSHSWHGCSTEPCHSRRRPGDLDRQMGEKARTTLLPPAQPMCSQQPVGPHLH